LKSGDDISGISDVFYGTAEATGAPVFHGDSTAELEKVG
jgi:hypothetical protein